MTNSTRNYGNTSTAYAPTHGGYPDPTVISAPASVVDDVMRLADDMQVAAVEHATRVRDYAYDRTDFDTVQEAATKFIEARGALYDFIVRMEETR